MNVLLIGGSSRMTDAVIDKLKELSGGLQVEAEQRYCNTAFYHYLKGEDYQ